MVVVPSACASGVMKNSAARIHIALEALIQFLLGQTGSTSAGDADLSLRNRTARKVILYAIENKHLRFGARLHKRNGLPQP